MTTNTLERPKQQMKLTPAQLNYSYKMFCFSMKHAEHICPTREEYKAFLGLILAGYSTEITDIKLLTEQALASYEHLLAKSITDLDE